MAIDFITGNNYNLFLILFYSPDEDDVMLIIFVSSGRAPHILIRAVARSAESHQASDSSEALQFLPLLTLPAAHHTFLSQPSHLFMFLLRWLWRCQ